MTDSTEVVVKQPFKSGNSKVITITGLPFIPDDSELAIKAVEIEGVHGCLMVPHRQINKFELMDKPREVEFKYDSSDTEE